MANQKITAPAGAENHVISQLPDHSLQFDFDTDTVSVDRAENDLVINLRQVEVLLLITSL